MNGQFRRRRLPHWDVAAGTYFVTTCLAGSISARGRLDLDQYRRSLAARRPPPQTSLADWRQQMEKLVFARLDDWLDRRPVVRHFDAPAIAAIVRESIYHFAEVRYRLIAYVIMPSHIHWVFHPLVADAPDGKSHQRTPRERIMHSLKSFTANRCNQALQRVGPFWQDESYDHWVRDEEELMRIIAYIEQNPVKAGMVADPGDYIFSSAHDRKLWGIPMGEALFLPS